MATPIFIVDAFTDQAFSGNPAAVCILADPAAESWMQSVANEMNLPETAFVFCSDESNGYSLRWFSPTTEVPLCGHATLASAHILWNTDCVPRGEKIRFQTLSGELTASMNDDFIDLDFPAQEQYSIAAPMELGVALRVDSVYVGRTQTKMLVEVASEAEARECSPDFVNLAKIQGIEGVIVTARAEQLNSGYDFVSRFFAPALGIDEDPVTGSSHCVLGPYWAARLGKAELTGYQASKRGGLVQVTVNGERVIISGEAVTVMSGQLEI